MKKEIKNPYDSRIKRLGVTRIYSHKNRMYIINYSLGYPLAYVRLPRIFENISYDDLNKKIGKRLPVELTYSGFKEINGLEYGWCVGWDYAHLTDWTEHNINGKIWTHAEIMEHAIKVIDLLTLQQVQLHSEAIYGKNNKK